MHSLVRLSPRHISFWVMVVLVLGIAACGGSHDLSEDPGPNVDLAVTFDGESCLGRSEAALAAGGTTISYSNSTDDKMQFSVIWLRTKDDLDATLADVPEGGEMEGSIPFPDGGEVVSWLRAEPRQEHEELVILESGWYVVNCLHVEDGATNPDHIWRAGSFEVREAVESTG